MIELSILIPTVPRRVRSTFPMLLDVLDPQLTDEVEVLGLYDNKRRCVGAKRNGLLELASGKYLTFIDDDDLVASDYVPLILDAIRRNPGADVICFQCLTTINGDKENYTISRYSIKHEYVTHGHEWYGKPAHTMVWRSEIAKACRFPQQNYAEDVAWVAQAWPKVKTEVQIDKILYFYDFDERVSETRG